MFERKSLKLRIVFRREGREEKEKREQRMLGLAIRVVARIIKSKFVSNYEYLVLFKRKMMMIMFA